MNYKSLTLIALALCLCIAVPVSAMWNNGNWIPDNSNEGYNIHFDPKTGVTSKYKDNNPVNEIKASENGNGGWAEGSIRAGYSTLSDTIYVRNVLQDVNSSSMVIKVNADTKFRIPEPDQGVLAPGNYTATLDNFNLPDETVLFTIAANQQGPTLIGDFVGQAVSPLPANVVAKPTPCESRYVYVGCGHGDYDKHNAHAAYYEIVLWGEHDGHASIVSSHDVEHHGAQYDFRVDGVYFRFNPSGAIRYVHHNAEPEHYVYVGHNHGDYDLVSTCGSQTPN